MCDRRTRTATGGRVALLLGTLLLMTGCTRPAERNGWDAAPVRSSALLFTRGTSPQPIRREAVGSTQTPSLADEWDVERSYTGTISADGGQGQQRVRATRQVGGYIETFTGTTSPSGSTYRRSFREPSGAGKKRRY